MSKLTTPVNGCREARKSGGKVMRVKLELFATRGVLKGARRASADTPLGAVRAHGVLLQRHGACMTMGGESGTGHKMRSNCACRESLEQARHRP